MGYWRRHCSNSDRYSGALDDRRARRLGNRCPGGTLCAAAVRTPNVRRGRPANVSRTKPLSTFDGFKRTCLFPQNPTQFVEPEPRFNVVRLRGVSPTCMRTVERRFGGASCKACEIGIHGPAELRRAILRRGRACRRHEIAWLAGPEDPASASKPAASTGWLRLGCTAQTKAPPEGRGSRHQTGLLARGLRERQQARHHNAEPQSWLHRLPPWRGWACRHEHPDQGRRLTSPIRAEPDKPAASTGGPAVGFEEEISLRRHPRNSRSTRLRDGPAFFAARFTLAFDFPAFFAS